MGFLTILNNLQAKLSRAENLTEGTHTEPDENTVLAFTETLYSKMIAVSRSWMLCHSFNRRISTLQL
jgi:hypothetical protein